MSDNTKRDFNIAAKTWDDNPMRIELAKAIVDSILKCIPISEEMSLLDYGAGTGLVTMGLQPYVKNVTAADSSSGMLDMLNNKITANSLKNVETMLIDMEHDKSPEDNFDVIVSSMTMHHIKDVSEMIACFCKMLHSGGYIAIADLDLDDGEFHIDPTGVIHNGFDRNQMMQFFTDNGLNNITVKTAHTLTREVPQKGQRDFSVFLICGIKQ